MIKWLTEFTGWDEQTVIITLIVTAVCFVGLLIYERIVAKKGINSTEKQEMRDIVNRYIPDGEKYTAVYAHYTETIRQTTQTVRRYYYYIVAFREEEPDHLWLMPVDVSGGHMEYTESWRMDADALKKADGNILQLCLLPKDAKWAMQAIRFKVEESNTKLGKECKVNIYQKEEMESFRRFAPDYIKTVNEILKGNHT